MGSTTSPAIFRATSGRLLSRQRAWEDFVSGGQPDLRPIPPLVLQSWVRSREMGVDPALAQAALAVPGGRFSAQRVANVGTALAQEQAGIDRVKA